jgi:calcium/calmodulin-dependent protein kinase (CaM kinase) II
MNEHEHEHEHGHDQCDEHCHDEQDVHDAGQELLVLSQQLLDAITAGDWETYEGLCDPSITCFEPEARGHLVEGLEFHKFYFDLGAPSQTLKVTTMVTPIVRLLGEEGAVVSYVRLNQRVNAAGEPYVSAVEETRVWERIQGEWKHVHFHRSPLG